jgi:hypothetical protein
MANQQILQHRIGDRQGTLPYVRDVANNRLASALTVAGDDMLLALRSRVQNASGVEVDNDLTGATAWRCLVRAEVDPDSELYGYTESPYTSDATLYALANGKVAFYLQVGIVGWSISGVNTGTKTFTLASPAPVGQFLAGDSLTISGSTGNDGTYTVVSATTTTVTVSQTVPSAVADGAIYHSAIDNATFDGAGNLAAWLEVSMLDSAGRPTTILPAFPILIREQLEGDTTGTLPGPVGVPEVTVTSTPYAVTVGDGMIVVDLDSIGGGSETITGVNQGTKTFTFASSRNSQWAAGATLVIVGSTGNDGRYTIASHSGADVVVVEAIPNATADGTGALDAVVTLPALSLLPPARTYLVYVAGGLTDGVTFQRAKVAANGANPSSLYGVDLSGANQDYLEAGDTAAYGETASYRAYQTAGHWLRGAV